MAEQATRRAPTGPTQEPPTDKQHDYEELRRLIVGPEKEGLAAIEDRLENVEKRTEDVSTVVAEAIQLRREKGDDLALAEALAPTIQATLRESVRRDPHVLADALFPVMGPAIRKSITETLRSMLESFNEALEHSLSLEGIQWRIEAMRTGKSFAEIAVMHSLLFRVEQIFLIHKETGLVLNHLVAPSVATQDPDMIAGMLTAIQQFVRDSFNSKSTESLGSLNVGELEVWLEESPDAVLAAVIRGHAPQDYRLAMNEALENIQRHYGPALSNFKGDAGPFRSAEEKLAPLLETHYKQGEGETKKTPKAAILVGAVLAALVLGWIVYSTYLVLQWRKFLHALDHQPGIVLVSHAKSGGKFQIQGFRDPYSTDPVKLLSDANLNPNDAELQLAPYYSLDDVIVGRRSAEILHPPAGVRLAAKNGELVAEGSAAPQWIAQFEAHAPWIAGVTRIDDSRLENSDLAVLKPLKTTIESTVILFPVGSSQIETGQNDKLAQAGKNFQELLAQAARLRESVTVEVTGHTDSTGIEGTNMPLSQERADAVRSHFLRHGIKPANMRTVGVGTSQPLHSEDTEEGRQFNRSVTFRIAFTPLPITSSLGAGSAALVGN